MGKQLLKKPGALVGLRYQPHARRQVAKFIQELPAERTGIYHVKEPGIAV